MTMRIAIEHHTIYQFTAPQARLVQMLRLTPRDTLHQTVASWQIDMSCDGRLRSGLDGHGNETTMLYAEGPLDSIDVTVRGEVVTTPNTGVLDRADEVLPPLVYRRSTRDTHAGAALTEFAERAVAGERDPLDQLWALSRALAHHFPDRVDKTSETAVDAIFALSAVSPRDLSQLFVAAARVIGAPARFVAGYSLSSADADGAATAHGWAEAYVDTLGWVGFDPSNDKSPDETYVRIAIGLDASDAAPIAGSRIGHGEEALDVDLHVDRMSGEE